MAMVNLALHVLAFAPRQNVAIDSDICRFQDVLSLGYAPNPTKLEGRQLEVAQLVALGLADKEIAHYLAISQGTVKAHVSMILRVLGLYRRTQICRFVHEMGLFPRG
jgi:DNA-binding NarL/FixJ family response regulator